MWVWDKSFGGRAVFQKKGVGMTRLKFLAAVKSHSTITTAPPPNLTRLLHNTTSYAGYWSTVCSLQSAFYIDRFFKSYHGVSEWTAWLHRGAFASFLKEKNEKSRQCPGGRLYNEHPWNWVVIQLINCFWWQVRNRANYSEQHGSALKSRKLI